LRKELREKDAGLLGAIFSALIPVYVGVLEQRSGGHDS
jgi:hypothetical protein